MYRTMTLVHAGKLIIFSITNLYTIWNKIINLIFKKISHRQVQQTINRIKESLSKNIIILFLVEK
jgi:hypothetical protein